MEDALTRSLRVIESLGREGVEYAVIGGVALNLHGIVRATEDLDIFIRPTPQNVERLRRALRAVWNDPEIEQITAEDLCGEYPAVRYGPPEGPLYIDILSRIGEKARFEDLQIEEVQVGNVRVRVASPRTLYRLKRATVRPIDRADAEALRRVFALGDEERS
jgi:nucleotidyltransferase AbiEii toxin of type IV toxin-antitoxin system